MFGVKFIKFQPNDYVLVYKKGKIVKEGAGLCFYYYAPTTSLVMVPMGSVEVPFIFEELSADFQPVTVQGQVSYRIIDPKKISKLLNYTLDSARRHHISEDPRKLQQRVINIVKVLAKKNIDKMTLQQAIKGSEKLAESVSRELLNQLEIKSLGLEILGLTILAIQPNKETARALEAQAREEILRQADEAVYERRNAAIEQERTIKENELNTDIAVENKNRQIRETQMEAERIVQQKKNELNEEQMNFQIELERKRKKLIAEKVENSKAEADAKGYELATVLKALQGIDPNIIQCLAGMDMQPDQLIALAFQGLAGKAEKIGQLNISPELMRELMKAQES